MTDALRPYLATYRDWIDAGAPEGKPFSRRHGLCGNAGAAMPDLVTMLRADFAMSVSYPFGGADLFLRERLRHTMHLNKDRIAYVRSKL